MSLDMLRKKESWFTRGVLILLAITFVLGFGFSLSNFGSRGSVPQGTAAEVNGEEISLLEFYKVRDRFYRQYRQQGEIPEGALNFIGITALNQLVDLKLMAQKAGELGFRVTDEELNEAIVSNPAFQVDGQFIGAEAYRSYVEQALNENASEFERGYREELLAQKLVRFINETAKVTDEELFNVYKVQNERVNVIFVSFSPEDFTDSFSPSEEEVRKHYEENKGEFKTPELRSVRYIAINPETFKKRVSVSEEEIKAYYDAYPDEFRSEEKGVRPLSEVRDDVKTKIQKQREELIRGELLKNLEGPAENKSLGEIAEENGAEVKESKPFSADENSADIPPQIVKRAFSVAEGEKTFSQAGDSIWVIEVTKVTPPQEKKLEDVKEEVGKRLKSVKAKDTARIKAEEVLNKAGKEGLEKAAKSLGLKVEETGFFSRFENVPKVSSDDLRIDAFLLNNQNPLASKVYSAGDKFYVISLKEKQEINPKDFEEKKSELKEGELSRRRRELYVDWVQKLRQKSKIVINESLFLPQG